MNDNIVNLKNYASNFTSLSILQDSPIYLLQLLKTGWDGNWAEPLSQSCLLKADKLWLNIEQITRKDNCLPIIRPSANGSVAFSWTHEYPRKELEIWLYDREDYYAEWIVSCFDNEDNEGTTTSQSTLLQLIEQYQDF